jgi:hypothetical protein
MFGNCLLGLHSNQKTPAAHRAVAGFSLVASHQH